MRLSFPTTLQAWNDNLSWLVIRLTKEQAAALGGRGRIAVRGTINGFPFRSSFMPMGGSHLMVVNKATRAGAGGIGAGDTVHVELDVDTEPRTVDVPGDLQEALAMEPEALIFFDELSYSSRRWYVEWVVSAKRAETRTRRVARAVELLRKGHKYPA